MTTFKEDKLGDVRITIAKTLTSLGEYEITLEYSTDTLTIDDETVRELSGEIYAELTKDQRIIVNDIIDIVEGKTKSIADI